MSSIANDPIRPSSPQLSPTTEEVDPILKKEDSLTQTGKTDSGTPSRLKEWFNKLHIDFSLPKIFSRKATKSDATTRIDQEKGADKTEKKDPRFPRLAGAFKKFKGIFNLSKFYSRSGKRTSQARKVQLAVDFAIEKYWNHPQVALLGDRGRRSLEHHVRTLKVLSDPTFDLVTDPTGKTKFPDSAPQKEFSKATLDKTVEHLQAIENLYTFHHIESGVNINEPKDVFKLANQIIQNRKVEVQQQKRQDRQTRVEDAKQQKQATKQQKQAKKLAQKLEKYSGLDTNAQKIQHSPRALYLNDQDHQLQIKIFQYEGLQQQWENPLAHYNQQLEFRAELEKVNKSIEQLTLADDENIGDQEKEKLERDIKNLLQLAEATYGAID